MEGFANERGLGPIFDTDADSQQNGRRAAPRSVAAPQPQARAHRRALHMLDGLGGLGWSVIGFVGGAVFWHFVGFWGFVSDVVLSEGPPPAASRAGLYAPALASRTRPVQVADASQVPCTLLALDRRTGVTSARPCDSDHAPLPADAFQGREDRIAIDERADDAARGSEN